MCGDSPPPGKRESAFSGWFRHASVVCFWLLPANTVLSAPCSAHGSRVGCVQADSCWGCAMLDSVHQWTGVWWFPCLTLISTADGIHIHIFGWQIPWPLWKEGLAFLSQPRVFCQPQGPRATQECLEGGMRSSHRTVLRLVRPQRDIRGLWPPTWSSWQVAGQPGLPGSPPSPQRVICWEGPPWPGERRPRGQKDVDLPSKPPGNLENSENRELAFTAHQLCVPFFMHTVSFKPPVVPEVRILAFPPRTVSDVRGAPKVSPMTRSICSHLLLAEWVA